MSAIFPSRQGALPVHFLGVFFLLIFYVVSGFTCARLVAPVHVPRRCGNRRGGAGDSARGGLESLQGGRGCFLSARLEQGGQGQGHTLRAPCCDAQAPHATPPCACRPPCRRRGCAGRACWWCRASACARTSSSTSSTSTRSHTRTRAQPRAHAPILAASPPWPLYPLKIIGF